MIFNFNLTNNWLLGLQKPVYLCIIVQMYDHNYVKILLPFSVSLSVSTLLSSGSCPIASNELRVIEWKVWYFLLWPRKLDNLVKSCMFLVSHAYRHRKSILKSARSNVTSWSLRSYWMYSGAFNSSGPLGRILLLKHVTVNRFVLYKAQW